MIVFDLNFICPVLMTSIDNNFFYLNFPIFSIQDAAEHLVDKKELKTISNNDRERIMDDFIEALIDRIKYSFIPALGEEKVNVAPENVKKTISKEPNSKEGEK